MEQVPHIAMYCQEFKAKLAHVVPESLLPMVVKFLTDFDIQVRKTSQAALLVLLEQGLVEKNDVKEQVCPVIIRLTEADSLDDYRTEAVAVSARIFTPFSKVFSISLLFDLKMWRFKQRVLHWVKDMGSEMFELCDTSHYFVFRLVGLALNKSRKLPNPSRWDVFCHNRSIIFRRILLKNIA